MDKKNKIEYMFQKIRERGVFYCVRRSAQIALLRLKNYIKLFFWNLENLYAIILPPNGYMDSVLAIYDFRANPYTFNFAEFLARAEVFRVKHSLSCIDLVFVADGKTRHRGDQPQVTDSNYRNWILNLAESAEPLKSVSSISIFNDTHKFLSFYHKARYAHKIYPETGAAYLPQASYHLNDVSDYYRATGFVPRFESSGVLLDWAEKYFLRNSCPFVPAIVFIRNSDIHPSRNTDLTVWFDFFRRAISGYPVKFFIINDFWNPVNIPADLAARVIVSPEATISVKYRAALTQKASLVLSVNGGSVVYCYFTDTPYLVFGFDNDIADAEFHLREHHLNRDLSFPWATKYQKTFPKYGDTEYIFSEFRVLYDLLKKDNRLMPCYYKSRQGDACKCLIEQ